MPAPIPSQITSHALAKMLLEKPDRPLTVNGKEPEYVGLRERFDNHSEGCKSHFEFGVLLNVQFVYRPGTLPKISAPSPGIAVTKTPERRVIPNGYGPPVLQSIPSWTTVTRSDTGAIIVKCPECRSEKLDWFHDNGVDPVECACFQCKHTFKVNRLALCRQLECKGCPHCKRSLREDGMYDERIDRERFFNSKEPVTIQGQRKVTVTSKPATPDAVTGTESVKITNNQPDDGAQSWLNASIHSGHRTPTSDEYRRFLGCCGGAEDATSKTETIPASADPPTCECGGDKAGTPHSTWCPKA